MGHDRITIRPAASGDAHVIAEFNRRIAEETEDLDLEPDTVRRGVEELLTDPARGLYRVAEMDGRVVAQMLITIEWSDWRCRWFWWIQSVYTAPEARGKGVFRALFEHVEAEARSREDVCGLRLYVEDGNEAAQAAYLKLGMERSQYVFYAKDL